MLDDSERPAAFFHTSEMVVFFGEGSCILVTEELGVYVSQSWSGLARSRNSHAPALRDRDEVDIRSIIS